MQQGSSAQHRTAQKQAAKCSLAAACCHTPQYYPRKASVIDGGGGSAADVVLCCVVLCCVVLCCVVLCCVVLCRVVLCCVVLCCVCVVCVVLCLCCVVVWCGVVWCDNGEKLHYYQKQTKDRTLLKCTAVPNRVRTSASLPFPPLRDSQRWVADGLSCMAVPRMAVQCGGVHWSVKCGGFLSLHSFL